MYLRQFLKCLFQMFLELLQFLFLFLLLLLSLLFMVGSLLLLKLDIQKYKEMNILVCKEAVNLLKQIGVSYASIEGHTNSTVAYKRISHWPKKPTSH